MIVTNTGSVFSWGENEYGQLGYNTPKKSKGVNFDAKPRKIELLAKEFIIDVACGEHHSLVLTNTKNVFLWGSNKYSQLGFDSENYPSIQTPKQLF